MPPKKKHFNETTMTKIDKEKWRVFTGICSLLNKDPHEILYEKMDQFIKDNSSQIKNMVG